MLAEWLSFAVFARFDTLRTGLFEEGRRAAVQSGEIEAATSRRRSRLPCCSIWPVAIWNSGTPPKGVIGLPLRRYIHFSTANYEEDDKETYFLYLFLETLSATGS